MFFIIPIDRWSLIGTTDTKYDGRPGRSACGYGDVDYLLNESRRILPGLNLTKGSILYTYAGIRRWRLRASGRAKSRASTG